MEADNGSVTGILCELCIRHRVSQHNNVSTLTTKPCSCIRRLFFEHHPKSAVHKEAVEKEKLRLQSDRYKVLSVAFEKRVSALHRSIVQP